MASAHILYPRATSPSVVSWRRWPWSRHIKRLQRVSCRARYLTNKHADCRYFDTKQTWYGPVFTWGSVSPQDNSQSESGFQRFSPAGSLSFQRGLQKLQYILKSISWHAKVSFRHLFIKVVQNTFPCIHWTAHVLRTDLCVAICVNITIFFFFSPQVTSLPSNASDRTFPCSSRFQFEGV